MPAEKDQFPSGCTWTPSKQTNYNLDFNEGTFRPTRIDVKGIFHGMAFGPQPTHGTFELLGLKNLLVKGINRVNEQTPALCALSATEQRQIREWQLHVSNGHKPFRRDCAVCLEGAGRD
jgi:hypothetical protein